MILSIIIFLLVLGVLVFIHELGHFLVAKWSGMRVDEFAIGFPPRIVARRRGETTYAINAIPFGGYVKIHGENPNPEAEEDSDPRSFDNKSVWKRMAVIVAGVAMNLVFAFVVLLVAFSVGFVSLSQDLTKIPGATVKHSDVVLTEVQKDGPAAAAGLEAGDYVRAFSDPVSGEKVTVDSVNTLQSYTRQKQSEGAERLTVHVERKGDEDQKEVVLRKEGLPLGVAADSINIVRLPLLQAPGAALHEMNFIIGLTWGALKDFGHKLVARGQLDENVSGPIGIYQATASAQQAGTGALVLLVVALSINLALLNILPIPALDGGKLLFLVIEAVFGKKAVSRSLEQRVSFVSFLLLIGLIIVLSVRDVARLF